MSYFLFISIIFSTSAFCEIKTDQFKKATFNSISKQPIQAELILKNEKVKLKLSTKGSVCLFDVKSLMPPNKEYKRVGYVEVFPTKCFLGKQEIHSAFLNFRYVKKRLRGEIKITPSNDTFQLHF